MRRISTVSGVFLVLLFPLYPSMAADPTDTDSTTIRINELFPNPINEKDEWIELHNFGSSSIDLGAGWKLRDKTTVYDFSREPDTIMPPDGYKVIRQATSKIELNNSNEIVSLIRLNGDKEVTIDSASYGTTEEEESYGYDGSSFRWSRSLTPEKVNRFEDTPNPVPTPDQGFVTGGIAIRINELFPNPKASGDTGEFIELHNTGDTAADISGFVLRDASKTGKYVLPAGTVIAARGYLAVSRAESGLSLNNTDETVSLSDPSGNPVDSASYGTTKEEASYSHDGSSFRWSRYLTPGEPNRFGDAPSDKKTDIPKKAYKDVPATFSAPGSDDRKYFWDFGDSGTSRKQEVVHTYEESGEYSGTLTISEGIEETVKSFTVDVGKFPERKVSIAAVSANPAGDDASSEWISLRNKDKKKIDLLGWSVATGSSRKKLSDHPIRESFVLKPGEERALTRETAAFSLPNGKGYVELRQPDGKVRAKTSYEKERGIKENEVWRKKDGGAWEWISEESPETPATARKSMAEPVGNGTEKPGMIIPVPLAPEAPRTVTLEDLSPEDQARLEAQAEEKVRRRIFAELLDDGTMPGTEKGAVLGASDERGGGYSGTIFRTINRALSELLADE